MEKEEKEEKEKMERFVFWYYIGVFVVAFCVMIKSNYSFQYGIATIIILLTPFFYYLEWKKQQKEQQTESNIDIAYPNSDIHLREKQFSNSADRDKEIFNYDFARYLDELESKNPNEPQTYRDLGFKIIEKYQFTYGDNET